MLRERSVPHECFRHTKANYYGFGGANTSIRIGGWSSIRQFYCFTSSWSLSSVDLDIQGTNERKRVAGHSGFLHFYTHSRIEKKEIEIRWRAKKKQIKKTKGCGSSCPCFSPKLSERTDSSTRPARPTKRAEILFSPSPLTTKKREKNRLLPCFFG